MADARGAASLVKGAEDLMPSVTFGASEVGPFRGSGSVRRPPRRPRGGRLRASRLVSRALRRRRLDLAARVGGVGGWVVAKGGGGLGFG